MSAPAAPAAPSALISFPRAKGERALQIADYLQGHCIVLLINCHPPIPAEGFVDAWPAGPIHNGRRVLGQPRLGPQHRTGLGIEKAFVDEVACLGLHAGVTRSKLIFRLRRSVHE